MRNLPLPETSVRVGINLLLTVSIANFAAEIFWIWAQPASGHAAIGAASSAQWGTDAGKPDYALLSTFDPFHRAVTVEQAVPLEAARETTLDLKLFGVRAGRDESTGSAIIRTPDKKQGAFRIGNEIMPGVTLRHIFSDRVVIAHRGQLENLYLGDTPAERTVAAPITAGVEDAEALMAAVRLEPRRSGRGIDGFVVSPGNDETLFRQLGFAPGDVLLAVNGRRLTDAERVREIGDELRNASTIRLEIERAGNRKIIELSQAE